MNDFFDENARLMQQQNQLLARQNNLIERQNQLLETLADKHSDGGGYVDNIDSDEIRSGYIVTSHQKKLWNVQIGLIQEFARICKKHNLRWFASDGTLLGAVRHKGFIPWDYDVDVMMFRPDYIKFQKIAATEIQPPYFLEIWCNHALETEGFSEQFAKENNLQFVSREEELVPWKIPWPKIRIRDTRTTYLSRPKLINVNQGVWLDIFPYDPAPSFDKQEQMTWFLIVRELTFAVLRPLEIRQAIKENANFLTNRDELQRFTEWPLHRRGAFLDDFQAKKFFDSKYIARTVYLILSKNPYIFHTEDFDETIYLPFERIEVPAPKGYDRVLTAMYGDWHKLVIKQSSAMMYSTEIPYAKYVAAAKSLNLS